MSLKYKFYITTSDKVMWTLKDCSKAFEHFCPNVEPIVLGYSRPPFDLPSNFKFVSMGADRGVEYWAEDLYNTFLAIEDDFFIWGLDDYEFQEPLDVEMINKYCPRYIDEDTNWFGLSEGPSKRGHEVIDDFLDFKVIKLKQNAEYRVTCQVNIWNRKRLLHYLKIASTSSHRTEHAPGTPWHFEILCSHLAKNDGYEIYAFKDKIPAHYRGLNYTVQDEEIQPPRIRLKANK
tara:strand:+ start:313 stop:1011 length:699 start_codon:yes stop_codon:yes gene_type:complete